jgi:hypothetical protein
MVKSVILYHLQHFFESGEIHADVQGITAYYFTERAV